MESQYTLESICLNEADLGLADRALMTDVGLGEGAAAAGRPCKAAPLGCEAVTPPPLEGA